MRFMIIAVAALAVFSLPVSTAHAQPRKSFCQVDGGQVKFTIGGRGGYKLTTNTSQRCSFFLPENLAKQVSSIDLLVFPKRGFVQLDGPASDKPIPRRGKTVRGQDVRTPKPTGIGWTYGSIPNYRGKDRFVLYLRGKEARPNITRIVVDVEVR